jgi:hypothetical protein
MKTDKPKTSPDQLKWSKEHDQRKKDAGYIRLNRWLTPNAWKAAVKAIEEEKAKEGGNG